MSLKPGFTRWILRRSDSVVPSAPTGACCKWSSEFPNRIHTHIFTDAQVGGREGWEQAIYWRIQPVLDYLEDKLIDPGTIDMLFHNIAGYWYDHTYWFPSGTEPQPMTFEQLKYARDNRPKLVDDLPILIDFLSSYNIGYYAYIGMPLTWYDDNEGDIGGEGPRFTENPDHGDVDKILDYYGELIDTNVMGIGHDATARHPSGSSWLNNILPELKNVYGIDSFIESIPKRENSHLLGLNVIAEHRIWQEFSVENPAIYYSEAEINNAGGRTIHIVSSPPGVPTTLSDLEFNISSELAQWQFDKAKELLGLGKTVVVSLIGLLTNGHPIEELVAASQDDSAETGGTGHKRLINWMIVGGSHSTESFMPGGDCEVLTDLACTDDNPMNEWFGAGTDCDTPGVDQCTVQCCPTCDEVDILECEASDRIPIGELCDMGTCDIGACCIELPWDCVSILSRCEDNNEEGMDAAMCAALAAVAGGAGTHYIGKTCDEYPVNVACEYTTVSGNCCCIEGGIATCHDCPNATPAMCENGQVGSGDCAWVDNGCPDCNIPDPIVNCCYNNNTPVAVCEEEFSSECTGEVVDDCNECIINDPPDPDGACCCSGFGGDHGDGGCTETKESECDPSCDWLGADSTCENCEQNIRCSCTECACCHTSNAGCQIYYGDPEDQTICAAWCA